MILFVGIIIYIGERFIVYVIIVYLQNSNPVDSYFQCFTGWKVPIIAERNWSFQWRQGFRRYSFFVKYQKQKLLCTISRNDRPISKKCLAPFLPLKVAGEECLFICNLASHNIFPGLIRTDISAALG